MEAYCLVPWEQAAFQAITMLPLTKMGKFKQVLIFIDVSKGFAVFFCWWAPYNRTLVLDALVEGDWACGCS